MRGPRLDVPLRFRPDLLVEALPGEGAVIVSDEAARVLTGPVFADVAARVDGARSGEDVVDVVDGVDPAEVYYALHVLLREGWLLEDGAAWAPSTPAPWSALENDVAGAVAGLPGPVELTLIGDLPRGEVRRAVEALGVDVGQTGAIRLVLADDYLRPELADVNREALASGRPWLLARPVGARPWAGPWFTPGSGPCWACLAQRLARNRPVHTFLAVRAGSEVLPTPPAAWTAASLRTGVMLALAETGKGEAPQAVGVLRPDCVVERHPVARRPQCPACGDPGVTVRGMSEPVRLRSAPKVFTGDGGHRGVAPEDTVARYEALVDPVCGVVDRVRRSPMPGWDEDPGVPIHLFVAGGNHAGPARELAAFRRGLRSWSGGKGVTEVQARASALGEAIERYSGAFQGDEPRVRATLEELGGDAIHPNDWMLFSDAQYRDRDVWNAHPSRYARVPLPFDPRRSMEWTPLWSLTHGGHRYLPTASLFYRYPHEGADMCVADSNGAASGNSVEEAVLQGFLELVERDAVAVWWYNRVRRPGVDLDAVPHPYGASLRERYAARGRELWALDLTHDLGIPCFAALSRRARGPREEILLGLGAHLDPAIALSRALTELNQMLGAVTLSGAKLEEEPTASWLRDARLDAHDYLRPAEGGFSDPFGRDRVDSGDLRDDVEACRRVVEERGMEFLVQVQTRPDIGVPVVRVVVPGLRHFRPRFSSGRLFDVPVSLRWSDLPTPENEMNPIPFFL